MLRGALSKPSDLGSTFGEEGWDKDAFAERTRIAGRGARGLTMNTPFLDPSAREDRVGSVLLIVGLGALAGLLAALIGMAVFVVGYGFAAGRGVFDMDAVSALVAQLASMEKVRQASVALAILCLVALTNGPLALGFTWVARLVRKRRLLSFITAAPRIRWRMVLAGGALYLLVLALVLPLDSSVNLAELNPPILTLASNLPARLGYAVAAAALLLLAAAAEELVFRGWLLQQAAAFVRKPAVLMAINGVLFAAIHFDPNLDAFLARAAMGAGFTWMALRTAGIEFSTGAHTAHNLTILLLIDPMPLAPAAEHPFDIMTVLGAALMLAAVMGVTELVLRVPALRRWTGADLAQARLAA